MKKIVFLLMLTLLQQWLVVNECLAQKKLRGALVSTDGSPVGSAKMYIEGFESRAITTSTDGYFNLEVPEVIRNQTVIRSYVVPQKSRVRYSVSFPNDSVKFITLTISPVNENIFVVKKNTKDNVIKNDPENQKIEVIEEDKPEENKEASTSGDETYITEIINPVDKNNTNPVEEQPKTIEDDIKSLTNELEKEQEIINIRNTRIQNEIKRITDRINSADLSPEEKEKLIEQIGELEEQLALNVEQFNALRDQIRKMKGELEDTTLNLGFAQQVLFGISGVSILLALLVYLFFVISRRRKREADLIRSQKMILEKQKNLLDERVDEISSQKEQLESQQELITQQKEILEDTNQKLEEKNKEIELQNKKTRDSIKAALTIQSSILPSENHFRSRFAEHFIIYVPKDIVSGDFYWLHNYKNTTLLGVIDCTGHGVPGAFMSVIGHSILTEQVKENARMLPSKLLDELNDGVAGRLKQLNQEENDDGMDASICLIENVEGEPNKRKVIFSGAKQEMVFFHKDKMEVVKGARRGIAGPYLNSDKVFEDKEFILDVGDTLYMYSDGLVDTPNPQRQRFGSKNLWDFLEANHHLPMTEQKAKLVSTMENYKLGTEQRDDVTFIGIRL